MAEAYPPKRARDDDRRLPRRQKKLAYLKLPIIDEPGFVSLSNTGAESLSEILSRRYERGSAPVTSNLSFSMNGPGSSDRNAAPVRSSTARPITSVCLR